jgi:predicted ATPase
MSALRLRELRLTSFKSYQNEVVSLAPLTIFIGRNGSGKSNALDALEVLSRLAQGEEVRDALEGNRRDGSPVRGGLEGCAPHGADTFSLGVVVADADGYDAASFWAQLDVVIQVRPDVRVVEEHLQAKLNGNWNEILRTVEVDVDRSDIFACIYNGKRGRNPQRVFRSSHLLSSQLALRLEGSTPAERDTISVVTRLLATLAGVFHLDPVPHLMRGYVPEQDSTLRRTGENLSAAVARLKREDSVAFSRLVTVARELSEHDLRSLEVRSGGFGDVMIALKERRGRRSSTIPARQMSDGMLRMLAIATALLSGGRGLALDKPTSSADQPPLCLVLEELENGLHPSQAARVLELVKSTSRDRHFQVVMTTHSPALLNALSGDDHTGVLVTERAGPSGSSVVHRLDQLPGYLRLMAQSRLGDAVTQGQLAAATRPAQARQPSANVDIDALLGIG